MTFRVRLAPQHSQQLGPTPRSPMHSFEISSLCGSFGLEDDSVAKALQSSDQAVLQ